MQSFQQNTAEAMNDPLAFVKKLWGDLQLPGMVTPTLSLDELDKQIKDLKTVESWLTLNMNMLRTSIQALEVQRATIAALRSMGESFNAAGQGAAASPNSHAFWPHHGAQSTAQSTAQTTAQNTAERTSPEQAVKPEVAARKVQAEVAKEKPSLSDKKIGAQANLDTMAHPAAWWNLVQDQFKQALNSVAQEGESPAPKKPAKPTVKSAVSAAKTKTSRAQASAVKSAKVVPKKSTRKPA